MTDTDRGILASGHRLVWRHQRVLWWVLAVNFVLGGLGASGAARTLSDALSHSLAGNKLTHGFDVTVFFELVRQPEVQLLRHAGGSFVFAGLFLLFMIFVMPGIIAVYLEERRLTTGEFFGASGSFFWSFVRLMLWSLIPFTVVNLLFQGVSAASDRIGDKAVADQTGFYILVIGCIPVVLLFLWVRLWFDLAEVRAVMLNHRAMHRNLTRTFALVLRRTWRVYWAYFFIGVLVWVITMVALILWAELPPTALPVTFVLLELIMLTHIFGRLWQKACVTTWYRLNPEPVPIAPEPYVAPEAYIPQPAFEPASQVVPDIDAPLSSDVEVASELPPDAIPPVKPGRPPEV